MIDSLVQAHEPGRPLALGLSGGPDSLALFYLLLEYSKKNPFELHIIHVDHGWRPESRREAEELEQLALSHGLTFHLERLKTKPAADAENICREQRLAFFKQVVDKSHAQALCLGHHRDDLAETVLKRLFEGARLEHVGAFGFESHMGDLVIWRPLIHFTKCEILTYLGNTKAFDDATNRNLSFLRARLREQLIPTLERQFGKKISGNLAWLSEQAHSLDAYLKKRCVRWLSDWQLPYHADFFGAEPLEIEYILGHLSLPRPLIKRAAQLLFEGAEHKAFEIGERLAVIHKKELLLFEAAGEWEIGERLSIRAAAPWRRLWCEGGYWPITSKEAKLIPAGQLDAKRRKKLFATPLFKAVPSQLRPKLPVSIDEGPLRASCFLRYRCDKISRKSPENCVELAKALW